MESVQLDELHPPGPSREAHSRSDSDLAPRITSIHRHASNVGANSLEYPSYVESVCHEEHAYQIVAQMELNPALMEDTPVSEYLRKEALRDLPQCLTVKRSVKAKLSKSVSQKSKRRPIGTWKRFKYRVSFGISKCKANMENLNSYFELWYGTLKTIEGQFGSGYASYFRFLRWLFVMNLLVAVPSFALLSVPQIIYDTSQDAKTVQSGFQFGDIFMGGGSFEDTILFYGHYTNTTIHTINGLYFDMPAAYFSIVVLLYLVYFFILSFSVARSYRRSYIETEGGLEHAFGQKIFCGWDYGIATPQAAVLKSASIYHELKELLGESYRNSMKMSFCEKFTKMIIHILVNIVLLVAMIGLGYGLQQLIEEYEVNHDDSKIVVAITINLIMLILPLLFTYISRLEDYKNPRTALYVTLIRTFFLGCVVLGAVMSFWMNKAKVIECWETHLGQEIYRLIMFDFIFSVVLTTIIEVCLYIFRRKSTEFNVARHTVQIIYNQAMLWIGFIFSPILPLVVTFKMFIIWYVRYLSVQKLCKPPAKTWRAAQTTTWFLMMTFIAILLTVTFHGYMITSISSSGCGPFRSQNYTYEIVTKSITNLEHQGLGWKIVAYITKPGVVALIMIFLSAWVYLLKAQAKAQRAKVQILRELLVWTAKDKEFLLQTIAHVSNGDYKHRKTSYGNPFDTAPRNYPAYKIRDEIEMDDFTKRFKKYT